MMKAGALGTNLALSYWGPRIPAGSMGSMGDIGVPICTCRNSSRKEGLGAGSAVNLDGPQVEVG